MRLVLIIASCMGVQPHAGGVGVAAGIQDQRNAVRLMARETGTDALGRRRTAKDFGQGVQRVIETAPLISSGTEHADQRGFGTHDR